MKRRKKHKKRKNSREKKKQEKPDSRSAFLSSSPSMVVCTEALCRSVCSVACLLPTLREWVAKRRGGLAHHHAQLVLRIERLQNALDKAGWKGEGDEEREKEEKQKSKGRKEKKRKRADGADSEDETNDRIKHGRKSGKRKAQEEEQEEEAEVRADSWSMLCVVSLCCCCVVSLCCFGVSGLCLWPHVLVVLCGCAYLACSLSLLLLSFTLPLSSLSSLRSAVARRGGAFAALCRLSTHSFRRRVIAIRMPTSRTSLWDNSENGG